MSNHHLKNRSFVFGGLIIVISTIFISRLAHIQLVSSDWSNYAGRLTEERETLDPMRGQFLDRNGKLLVANIASYDLLFTPRRSKNLDTLKLANLLGLNLSELVKRPVSYTHLTLPTN